MSGEKKLVIFCVGANHNSAGMDFRERLFVSEEQLVQSLPELRTRHQLLELMVVSTCNRFELYGVIETDSFTAEDMFTLLSHLEQSKGNGNIREGIRQHCYTYTGIDTLNHMFSVASGLDSLVLGETQITGQFKDAAQFAQTHQLMGSILNKLTQDALNVAKKVRTHTDIGKKPVSISHAAIDLANRVYGNISNHTVLIIGAGEMASVAAKNVIKYNPKSLFVVNRTVENAERIVKELQTGQAYPLDQLNNILPLADIIISSTSADHAVITKAMIEKVLVQRQHRPLFLIDIALPRDIEPACAQLDDIYLFDIDDLKQVVAEHVEERRLAAEKAKGMVIERAGSSMKWIGALNIKPALSHFRSYLDDLINREIDRTLSRSHLQNLSAEQVDAIRSLLQSIAGKISSDASARVRTPPDGFFQEQLAAALTVLFPMPSKSQGEGE